tara:strand:+ start:30 stop:683 length:654 start_codon:yes stop_codon:yes gene_type:complete
MKKDDIFFVIPARRDSKGLPFKNRKLLDYTLNEFPNDMREKVIVTTNDEEIIEKLSNTKFNVLKREEKLSDDKTSIRDVIQNVVEKYDLDESSTIVMLYLTSPNRKYEDIQKIIKFYFENKCKTLTCCVKPKTHPYLCLLKKEDGKGKQIISHDLYRRQDYPECIELSHFVCIFQVDEISNLNKNMYNADTYFYQISDDVDIDYESDLELFEKQKND